MTEFGFVDKLPAGGRPPNPMWAEFAAALRARPGVWCVWPKTTSRGYAARVACAINKGALPAPPALREGFEAASRLGVVYVRFAGDAA